MGEICKVLRIGALMREGNSVKKRSREGILKAEERKKVILWDEGPDPIEMSELKIPFCKSAGNFKERYIFFFNHNHFKNSNWLVTVER
jgi:hypothetical protein